MLKDPKAIAPLQREQEKGSKTNVLCGVGSAVAQRGDSTKRQIVLPQRFRN